jgi:hypothetical protein
MVDIIAQIGYSQAETWAARVYGDANLWIIMSPEEKAVVWARLNRDGWWNTQQSAFGTSGADRRARNA